MYREVAYALQPFLPGLTSCITIVQYEIQEVGIVIMHKA